MNEHLLALLSLIEENIELSTYMNHILEKENSELKENQ